jgi:queuine tRNA-ribosyltransferase
MSCIKQSTVIDVRKMRKHQFQNLLPFRRGKTKTIKININNINNNKNNNIIIRNNHHPSSNLFSLPLNLTKTSRRPTLSKATNNSACTTSVVSTFTSLSTPTPLNHDHDRYDSHHHHHHHHEYKFPNSAYEPKDFFRYELIYQSKKKGSMARVGKLHTPNGVIDTPSYVPVATNAALKGVDFRTLDEINMNHQNTSTSTRNDTGADAGTYDDDDSSKQLVFCNTYHLLLHPGREVIRDAGGLHNFTSRGKNRNGSGGGPFITDSGGFQVFSLMYGSVESERQQKQQQQQQQQQQQHELKKKSNPKPHWNLDHMGPDLVSVSEEGVTFKSYRDGSTILLTPESTIHAQKDFGADIIIPLDELPPHHISRETLMDSVRRSHRWEARSLQTHLENIQNQAMYGVIHGGLDTELRTESLNFVSSLPFDGYAIGGSLGTNRDDLKSLLSWFMPLFESNEKRRMKPRHLLGIADEESIRNAVALGIDTMDSCYPTKLGRHGTLLTSDGVVRIKRGQHARSFGIPIEEGCMCKTCTGYDRAYLNHLFKANEPLAMMLGTQHNLFYMQNLMRRIREDILNDKI